MIPWSSGQGVRQFLGPMAHATRNISFTPHADLSRTSGQGTRGLIVIIQHVIHIYALSAC